MKNFNIVISSRKMGQNIVITEPLPRDTSTTKMVRDLFLIDFYQKFTQNTQIINIEQVIKWDNYFKGKSIQGISCLKSSQGRFPLFLHDPHDSFDFHKLTTVYLSNNFPTILQILLLGEGKISICGANILYMYGDAGAQVVKFYFDSCTVKEATNLLLECLKILGEDAKYLVKDNTLYYKYKQEYYATFDLSIYENKGSMLRNVGPAPDRHGWNPKDGYFATISGGMTLTMGTFPFDIEFKYKELYQYDGLGLSILFHGFSRELIWGDVIETTDGFIESAKGDIKITFGEGTNSEPTIPFSEVISSLPSITLYKDMYKPAIKPNTWFKGNYTPYIVGITDDRYVALNNIGRAFNIPNEIIKILCLYSLTAEASDAKQRLFLS